MEGRETHDSQRAQETASSGTRCGVLKEPDAGSGSHGRLRGCRVPLLATPGRGVADNSLHAKAPTFLLAQNLAAQEKKKAEDKRQVKQVEDDWRPPTATVTSITGTVAVGGLGGDSHAASGQCGSCWFLSRWTSGPARGVHAWKSCIISSSVFLAVCSASVVA